MASFSGFVRKSPATRLRSFLENRAIEIPGDFDWTVTGRGPDFLKSIESLIADATERRQDKVKAELDLLSSLADETGMLAMEQVCRPYGIDLEGLEGVEDALLMLATDHADMIDRVNAQVSLMRRTGGRDWAAYQLDDGGTPWTLDDPVARKAFLEDAIEILQLPSHRKRDADWYQSIRVDPASGEETEILQATLYVEERPESRLEFGDGDVLERRVNKRVLEVGLACDARNRVIEICAKGGAKTREQYARSFAKHFAASSSTPKETPRRDVHLDLLRDAPELRIEPADGIERVEVSSLDFRSPCGGYNRVEKRGDGESIYTFLERKFGPYAASKAHGWFLVGSTLRIVVARTDQKRKRTLTVTLRAPNTTTLPNKTEADRQFVFGLLERWGLLAPRSEDVDVVETT